MSNYRLQQIFAKRETLPGVVATSLVVAANVKNRIKDPRTTPQVEAYEREILYGSLSALTTLAGKVEMNTTFEIELAGLVTGTNAPNWSLFMEACGMRLAAISGGTWSGGMTGTASGTAKVAKSGDLWRNAAGDHIIRIVHDTYESTTPGSDSRTIFFEQVTGTATTEAFYPSSSDGTIGPVITLTAGAPGVQRGHAFIPTSTPVLTMDVASLAGTHTADDVYRGGTSGAILQAIGTPTATSAQQFRMIDSIVPASGGETFTSLSNGSNTLTVSTPNYNQLEIPTISLAHIQDGRIITTSGNRGSWKLSNDDGKPPFLAFTFKGVFQSAASAGSVSGVSFDSKVPPRFMGVDLYFQSYVSGEPGYVKYDTAHRPRHVSSSIDFGAEANLEDDAGASTGVGSFAHLTGTRKTNGTIKISVRPEGAWAAVGKHVRSEAWGMRMRISDPAGGSAATNNTFVLSMPGNKTTGIQTNQTKNFLQDDVAFSASSLNPDGSEGDKREVVLSYHHATNGTLF